MNERWLKALLVDKANLEKTIQVRVSCQTAADLDEFIRSTNSETGANLNRSDVVRAAIGAFLEGVREAA